MLPAVFCVLLCALLAAWLFAERRQISVLRDQLRFAQGQERRLQELARTRSDEVRDLQEARAALFAKARTERQEADLRIRALQRLLAASDAKRDSLVRERGDLDVRLLRACDERQVLRDALRQSLTDLERTQHLVQRAAEQDDEREERHAAAIVNLERLLEEARTVRNEALAESEAAAVARAADREARAALQRSRERVARAEQALAGSEVERVALFERLNNQGAEVLASREDARVAWEALHRQQQAHLVYIGQVEAGRDAALAERDAALEHERRISAALRRNFDERCAAWNRERAQLITEIMTPLERAGTRRERAPDDLERHVRARAAAEM